MNGYINAMRRYFDFSGRSSRPEFWFFVLFVFILNIIASVLDAVIFGSTPGGQGYAVLSGIVSLVHLIPSLSVSVRRLHDIDRTGWWILLGVAPVILMIVLMGGSLAVMLGTGGDTGAGMAAMGGSLLIVGLVALIIFIVLLVFYCTPGTPGPNRFGSPQTV